jgi:hypothetical protein
MDPATAALIIEGAKEAIAYGMELYSRWGDENYTPPAPEALEALAAQIEALPPLLEE